MNNKSGESGHLGEKKEFTNDQIASMISEAVAYERSVLNQKLSHLQKLCEEQKGEIERLKSVKMLTRTDEEGNSETHPIDRVVGLQELEIASLKSQLATQTERVNAQDAEIEKLRAFADHILQNYSWDNYCFEIDPADAQDKAEELGLIEKRDVNPDDYDGADWAYFTKWTPKEALNQESLGDGK